MPIKTKRWNDPKEVDDGFRLLICRYRPRALPKDEETWDAWDPSLGPTAELLAAFHGKKGVAPISWDRYRRHYLHEQRTNQEAIAALARRAKAGETITLLCASACTRESRCHRSLLKELIDKELESLG